jgi:hypothetical protein
MNRFITKLLAVTAVGLTLLGCTPRQRSETPKPLLSKKPATDILVAVFDRSGSFETIFDEHAYGAIVSMIRQFKRDLVGEEGTKLILGQISSDTDALFFDGTVAQFGRQCGSAGGFKSLLRKYHGTSPVFDAVSQAAEYMEPMVGPDSRACLVVFSDFEDTASGPGAENRMVDVLAKLGRKNVSVGCYWVSRSETARTEQNLVKAGIKNRVVESKISASITLPNFEK